MKHKSLFLGLLLLMASITTLQAGKAWKPIQSLEQLQANDVIQLVMKDGGENPTNKYALCVQFVSYNGNQYLGALKPMATSTTESSYKDYALVVIPTQDGWYKLQVHSSATYAKNYYLNTGVGNNNQPDLNKYNFTGPYSCQVHFRDSYVEASGSWKFTDLGNGCFRLSNKRDAYQPGFLGMASATTFSSGYNVSNAKTPSYTQYIECLVNQFAENKTLDQCRQNLGNSENATYSSTARFAGAWKIYKLVETYTATFNAGEHGTIDGNASKTITDVLYSWPVVTPTTGFIHTGWQDENGADAVAQYDIQGLVNLTEGGHTFTATYLQAESITPMYWKENAIILSYLGGATTIETKVCTTDAANPYVGGVYSATTSNSTTSTDGVLELNVATGALLANAGKKLVLTFKDGEGNVIGVNALTIPTIITGTKSWSAMSIPSTADVVILNGGTLNVDAAATCHDITISGGAKLVVPNTKSLTAHVINMQGGALEGGQYKFRYPQLVANGSITTTNNKINYDYLVNTAQYYSLVLPADVSTADIKYALTGKNPIFGIQTYDGANRLDGKSSGWETLVDANNMTTATLTAGTGYTFFGVPAVVTLPSGERVRKNYDLFRFPMTVDLSLGETANDGKRIIVVTPYGKDQENVKPNDKGWNLVGNPYLATINGVDGLTSNGIGLLEDDGDGYSWTGDVRYVVIPKDNGLDYDQREAANTPLPAFKNFFVQIGDGDALEFTLTDRAQSAPARMLEARPVHREVMTGIVLSDATQSDKMGMLIGEGFTDAYEINADLQKWMNSKLNIYAVSAAAGGDLAYIAIDSLTAANNIQVGFTAPATGNYTICMDQERYANTDIQALYLTDTQTGNVTNLLYNDYVFASNKGTFNTRFLLACQLMARTTPTDLQTMSKGNAFATSNNGILHLHRLPINSHVMITNMAGQLIQDATAMEETTTLAIPQGLYTIRIVGNEGEQTIQTIVR